LPVIEVKQHRRALGRGDQQVLELPEGVRADHGFDVGRRKRAIRALAEEHVEVVGPEIDHDLVELAL
jgi:hypothetical protein